MSMTILTFLLFIILIKCRGFVSPLPLDSQADSVIVEDVAFFKLGTYRGFTTEGVEYQKSFFLSRYSKAPWAEARSFCNSYSLESPTLETLEEARAFVCMLDNNTYLKTLGSAWVWIDGITLTGKSTTDWYWTKSGRKLSFPIDWYPGNPSNIDQFCLCVSKATINAKFGFNDCNCPSILNISCQRVEFFLS